MTPERYLKSLSFQYSGKNSTMLMHTHPNVSEIIVKLDYSDNDEYVFEPQKICFKPDTAFMPFVTSCKNPTCTNGYFNLTDKILSMLRNKIQHDSIEFVCNGKQKKYSQFQCLFKVNCQITIKKNTP